MSLLYIFFIPSDPHAVKLLFKLIPMWLIIVYAYLQIPSMRERSHWVLFIGLFFCMLGDGLLGSFVVGLSAFLIGHLFYMTGFFSRWHYSRIRFATVVPIALYCSFMGRELIYALIRNNNESLIVPVLLYVIVISLMTWSAIMTGRKWAIIGSLLFAISDSILSWNLFVSDISFSGPLVMTTYYAAQFCIAYSIRTIADQSKHNPISLPPIPRSL
ncbi:putative membrane protein YhhN [Paenibacillus sp. DS2015]|uniref:lysoplasmalogenase n=1 Tax=Paenibacillus sp. DS2015 TaxID=3373917 RepID=UPI003D1F6499